MSKDTLEQIKKHYMTLRNEIVASIKIQSIEVDTQGDDIDKIQGKALSAIAEHLGQRDLARLRRIDVALEKIADGSFGQCEECGCQIGERRLTAIPGVETCIKCAEELEHQAFAYA